MRFEDYCKEEFEKLDAKIDISNEKIDRLMIFMAVTQAEEAKKNKHTSAIIAIVCSVSSSGIMLLLTRFIGG